MSGPASTPDEIEALERSLDELEEAIGHQYGDRGLLERALCHSSHANETEGESSNETMEFLGDSVIGLAVSHILFEAKPDWREGELTRALHGIVEGRSLAAAARRLGLGPYLRLGRTERQSGGHEKDSILEDAMEAIFASLYLDDGLSPVVGLARKLFGDSLSADAPRVERHPKMRFNERVMQRHGSVPKYRLVEDSGIDDDDDRFVVAVEVDGDEVAHGRGRTKRAAEREAAETADDRLFGMGTMGSADSADSADSAGSDDHADHGDERSEA